MGRSRKYDTHRGGNKAKAPVGDDPRVKIIRHGSRTSVGTAVTFADGTDVIGERQRENLYLQAKWFRGKPQKIEVRGHTSRKPPIPPGDHWDLAYRRCREVMGLLLNQGIDPRRIRLSVAGPNEPVYLGADPEKIGLNRRVDVFLLDEQVSDYEGTAEQRARQYRLPSESPNKG